MFKTLTRIVITAMAVGLAAPGALAQVKQRDLLTSPGTFPFNHGATLIELPNRVLISCWFTGSAEAQRDVRIVCSRQDPSGIWSVPRTAVGPGERAEGKWFSNKFVGNPVLLVDDDAYVWLFYESVALPFGIGGHSGAYVDYKLSKDGGETWSSSKRLVGNPLNVGHLPRNHALRIGKNRFLLPLYREFTESFGYVMELEIDGGKITNLGAFRIPGRDHIQPSLVRISGNTVAAYLRNKSNTKSGRRVLVAYFDLPSRTWSRPVATNLPNPNAAVDAVPDLEGNVIMVYNSSEVDRSRLSVASSRDGLHFEKLLDLETGYGHYSYPSVIKGLEGTYHVVYSYNGNAIGSVCFKQAGRELALKVCAVQ